MRLATPYSYRLKGITHESSISALHLQLNQFPTLIGFAGFFFLFAFSSQHASRRRMWQCRQESPARLVEYFGSSRLYSGIEHAERAQLRNLELLTSTELYIYVIMYQFQIGIP